MTNTHNSGDQVALAVDKPKSMWADNKGTVTNYYTCFPIAKPLTDTFYKNAIASGSIVPPSGESANVRRNDIITGLCVVCFLGFGVAAFIVAMLIQRSH